jgi:DNA-binding PadR family transcriptional regulator
MVAAGEIAEFLGLNLNDSTVKKALVTTGKHLEEQGFIEGLTDDYSLISVADKGVNELSSGEEVVSIASGTSQRSAATSRTEQRRQFLEALYEIADGNIRTFVSLSDITRWLRWNPNNRIDEEAAIHVAEYLAESGFITIEVEEGTLYRITGKGIEEVERYQPSSGSGSPPVTPDNFSDAATIGEPPVEIRESLQRFKRDYPNAARVAFIMMQFENTRTHEEITAAVREGLATRDITGVRADEKRYHDDLLYNVLTYLHGCGLGVAIFERIKAEATNPNVALEVGYLFAMRKPVCFLKDHTLAMLPADLVGRLYDPFDTQEPAKSIPPVIQKWLSDKDLPQT